METEGLLSAETKEDSTVDDDLELSYIDVSSGGEPKKSIEGKILDELKIHKYCCRRMMLTNVHLISYI